MIFFFQNIDVSGSLENALNTRVLETMELELLSENWDGCVR